MLRALKALALAASAFLSFGAQAQSLSASPSSLYPSDTVTGAWSGIATPTATDWVGLYLVGAADTAYLTLQYTNGSASGNVPIAVPNTTHPGSYELRLFANDGYTKLATSNGITVNPQPQASLSASPATLYPSQTITGTWSSIYAPTATDWVGLYLVGAADTAPVIWHYTSGSASGNLPIVVPNITNPGSYELRLFWNDGYTKLATSNGVTIDPPPPATLSAAPASTNPGASVTATWGSILAPTPTDWIGLYTPGSPDAALISWRYTSGTAAGNVPFSIPANLAPGSYELRLFANNGYTKLATSNALTVALSTAKLSFIHVDHLNTPREIYDDQQQLRWRWDQAEPFGVNTPDENPGSLGAFEFPLRLPGQYQDKETNLAYNYFRDYWPDGGRYVQSDPIGLRGGLNTYSYGFSDPVSNYDPNGLEVRLGCRPLAGALGATGQQHCYVFVSCPAEGWSRILSLFAGNASATRGRKSLADPETPTRRDDPSAPGNIGITITPSRPGCDSCAYEKDVMNRFLAFPAGDVPYFILGPNSNSFAQYLITSPAFGAGLPPTAPSNAPGFGLGWPGFGLPSR